MRTQCIRENTFGEIRCDDYEVLTIIRALYGSKLRIRMGCAKEESWHCVTGRSSSVVRKLCERKNNCTILPHQQTFKLNPCPGRLKFLEVQYNCLQIAPYSRKSMTRLVSVTSPNFGPNLTGSRARTTETTGDSSRSLGVIIGPIAATSILILTIVATLIFVFTRKRNISQQPDKSANENRNRAITDKTQHINDLPVSNPSQIRSEFDDYLTMTSATTAERVYEVALEFSETNPPLQQTPGYQTVKINPADDIKYTAYDVTTAGNDIPSSTSEYIANGAVPGGGEYEEQSVVFHTKGICFQGDSGSQTIRVLPSKHFERTDREANPTGHDYEVIGAS